MPGTEWNKKISEVTMQYVQNSKMHLFLSADIDALGCGLVSSHLVGDAIGSSEECVARCGFKGALEITIPNGHDP